MIDLLSFTTSYLGARDPCGAKNAGGKDDARALVRGLMMFPSTMLSLYAMME